MRPPDQNLPPESMPWGRWLTDEIAKSDDAVDAAVAQVRNASSQVFAQADNAALIVSQMYSRSSVLLEVSDISGTASGTSGWISYGVNYSFAAPAFALGSFGIIASMTIPGKPPASISSGPDRTRILVNGSQLGGVFGTPTVLSQAGAPITSSRVSMSVNGVMSPGAVNTIRIELGSYRDTTGTYNLNVAASQVELFLTFRST